MMYNLGVEFSNSCCQVFWPSVPGQQGVHCLAQAGQKGISIPLSGDGQKMFILLGIVLFSSSGDGISFPGDGAAGGSEDVAAPPSFPCQVLS